MQVIKGRLLQDTMNTDKVFTIDTGLGVLDQKTLWELVGMEVEWSNAWQMPPVANYRLRCILTRDLGHLEFLDNGLMSSITWAFAQGSTLTDVQAIDMEMHKRDVFVDKPWMANTKMYVVLNTSGMDRVADMSFKLYYEEKKVTEVEFLKAQSAYCIC